MKTRSQTRSQTRLEQEDIKSRNEVERSIIFSNNEDMKHSLDLKRKRDEAKRSYRLRQDDDGTPHCKRVLRFY